jgi:ribosomal protein S13
MPKMKKDFERVDTRLETSKGGIQMSEDLQALTKLDITELQQRWRAEFKSPAPHGASRPFLLGHLAWHLQAKQHGGLGRAAARQLQRLIQQMQTGKELTSQHAITIKPGTKLLREYQGTKHEVIVTERGYRYQNTDYASLSAIARTITGTQWNGKLFFGVKR